MGPLKGRPAWNEVAKPMGSGNHIAVPNNKSSRPTARAIPSREASGDVSKMGTHESEKSVQRMGRGNVRKSKQTSPGSDMDMAPAAMWGGRGVGGY